LRQVLERRERTAANCAGLASGRCFWRLTLRAGYLGSRCSPNPPNAQVGVPEKPYRSPSTLLSWPHTLRRSSTQCAANLISANRRAPRRTRALSRPFRLFSTPFRAFFQIQTHHEKTIEINWSIKPRHRGESKGRTGRLGVAPTAGGGPQSGGCAPAPAR